MALGVGVIEKGVLAENGAAVLQIVTDLVADLNGGVGAGFLNPGALQIGLAEGIVHADGVDIDVRVDFPDGTDQAVIVALVHGQIDIDFVHDGLVGQILISAAEQYLIEKKYHDGKKGRPLDFLLVSFAVGDGCQPGEERFINQFLKAAKAVSGYLSLIPSRIASGRMYPELSDSLPARRRS